MGLSFLGLIGALAMYAVSVSPSLMARSWWWHAVASGVLVSIGYILGLIVQSTGARLIKAADLRISADESVEWASRAGVAVLFLAWWLYAVVQSYRRARRAAALFGNGT